MSYDWATHCSPGHRASPCLKKPVTTEIKKQAGPSALPFQRTCLPVLPYTPCFRLRAVAPFVAGTPVQLHITKGSTPGERPRWRTLLPGAPWWATAAPQAFRDAAPHVASRRCSLGLSVQLRARAGTRSETVPRAQRRFLDQSPIIAGITRKRHPTPTWIRDC